MADDWAYRRPGDNEWVPRLTRVLAILAKPELAQWQARVGAVESGKVAQATSKIGTSVHKRIQQTLLGKKVTASKAGSDVARAYGAWLAWRDAQRDFVPTRLETLMFSPLGFAGTPDCVEDVAAGAAVNRVTEWKITGAIQQEHWVQGMAQVALAWPRVAMGYGGRFPDGSVHICYNLEGREDGGSCRLCRSMPPFIPTVRVVRVDPFLGMVEARERPFSQATLATFLNLLDVYRAWYFKPYLQRMEATAQDSAMEDAHDTSGSTETDVAD